MDYALLRLCIPFSGDPREQGRQIHFRRRNARRLCNVMRRIFQEILKQKTGRTKTLITSFLNDLDAGNVLNGYSNQLY